MGFDSLTMPQAGAIASGGNFLSGVLGSVLDYSIAKQNIAAQKSMQESQNKWNLDMWEKQNEYNTPMNQMKRFAEAGLNKNLVAGNPGNASMPHPSASFDPSLHFSAGDHIRRSLGALAEMPFNYLALKKGSADISLLKSQQDLNQANVKRVEADTMLSILRSDNIKADTKAKFLDNYYKSVTMGSRVQKVDLENENLRKKYDVMVTEIENMVSNTQNSKDRHDFYLATKKYDVQAKRLYNDAMSGKIDGQKLQNELTQLLVDYSKEGGTPEMRRVAWEIENGKIHNRREGIKLLFNGVSTAVSSMTSISNSIIGGVAKLLPLFMLFF